MSNSVNTNLSALFGLNQLSRNQNSLQLSLQKISSGSRINSARDDAAGLAIANRFSSQINGLNVAVRNANDGISFAQTAESALSEVTTSLQRIRDLSLQAANGANSPTDRKFLQQEVDQLRSEINRIAETTTFNGQKVFGDDFSLSFQIGANSNQTVNVSSFDASASALGSQPGALQSTSDRAQLEGAVTGTQGIQEGNATAGDISDFTVFTSGTAAADQINIADESFGGEISTVQNTSELTDSNNANFGSGVAKSIAERINGIRESGEAAFSDVFATARTDFNGADLASADFSGNVDTSRSTSVGSGELQNGDLTINGIDIGPVSVQSGDSDGSLTRAINAKSDQTGVTASVNSQGELQLSAEDGRDIVLSTDSSDISNIVFGGSDARFDAAFSDLRISGRVTVSANDSLNFSGGDNAITGFDDLSVAGAENNVQGRGTLANADITSQEGAGNAIDAIDSALGQIDSFRARLGAVQNRFESSIRNLSAVSESQTAARSRIQDTDFASQVAELSKSLVRQQAGIAVQAQANAISQRYIALLS